ncbi:YdjY domain-containing protein [Prosthecobacter sp.]|uniref:YdjY domain-containing protein n=1 Tax=Prosthecobacter sp. TaxID=1965333 RepID=UPI0024898A70|nr:YdjY domain-containing protein [Prosthecobacter sp.]MDI1315500.1 YdjY domain-containing protein [Prosthecobacter sp.]
MLRQLTALALLITCAHTSAQDAAEPKPDAKAQLEAAQKLVKQVSPGVFDLNGIQITAATRELRIPCSILHQKLPIEYALCHETGEKVHETVLETKVRPIQIQLALLLANYQPGTLGILEKLDPKAERPYNAKDTAPKTPGANRIAIHVEWKDGDKIKNVPLSDFIQNIEKRQTPDDLDTWIFNGSIIDETGFAAEQTGSIISTYVDRAAIINSAAKGNERDDLWISMPANIPAEETKVTLIITPAK